MKITKSQLRQIIKEEIDIEIKDKKNNDEEKLELGNKLIQLRLPSNKDYHFPSLNDFFRIVKDVEKFPQSEDELYDAYMYAKREQR
jgi:hypothetical protein